MIPSYFQKTAALVSSNCLSRNRYPMKRETVIASVLKNAWVIPILLGFAALLLSLQNSSKVLQPSEDYSGLPFNDSADQGKSSIRQIKNDSSGVEVVFRLEQGFTNPYAGIIFHLSDSLLVNLSTYDYLYLKIACKDTFDLSLHLRSFVEGFTKPDDLMSYRFLVKEIHCTPPEKVFKIPISSFTTPQWWYSRYRIESDSFPKESFSRIADFVIQSGVSTPFDKDLSLKLQYVGFHKDGKRHLIWWAFFTLGYLVLLYAVKLVKSRKRKPSLVMAIGYEKLQVANYADEEAQRIISYIAKNFQNPDLEIAEVGREVGLSQTRISGVLKTAVACGFKQYLNTIRITEAKRLLRDTDRQVADIARKVGYNNIAHFNRIFKVSEGISPNQYRKKEAQVEQRV